MEVVLSKSVEDEISSAYETFVVSHQDIAEQITSVLDKPRYPSFTRHHRAWILKDVLDLYHQCNVKWSSEATWFCKTFWDVNKDFMNPIHNQIAGIIYPKK